MLELDNPLLPWMGTIFPLLSQTRKEYFPVLNGWRLGLEFKILLVPTRRLERERPAIVPWFGQRAELRIEK